MDRMFWILEVVIQFYKSAAERFIKFLTILNTGSLITAITYFHQENKLAGALPIGLFFYGLGERRLVTVVAYPTMRCIFYFRFDFL
jgi:hypothetical protein